MSNDKLVDVLKQLAATVKKTVNGAISNGTIQSEEQVYFHWKVEKFRYTDKGIADFSAHAEYTTKRSWLRATIEIEETIKQHSDYSFALEQMADVFGKSDRLSHSLGYFVGELIHRYLYDSKLEEADINSLVITFLKDLREEPLKYGAEVELQGISLQPEIIEPDFGITLRQTKIEDLEREVPVYGFGLPYLSHPSGILKIEFLGRRANEIQKKVELAIAILRLFKVGSIKWLSYRMYTESVTDVMASGTLTSGQKGAALDTCLVTQEDVPKLRKFWQTINSSIPTTFFEPAIGKTDHTAIAYNRYSDALLQDGILERRIANAIMGLEALFLKPGETQELAYRLSTRVSKLLSLVAYDPHEIKEILRDAYHVRNLFVHGSQLTYKKKKKLESKYKDVKNILLSVLEYLRVSIVLMLFNRKEKDEFIDLLDASLVDRKQEEQLDWAIAGAKEVIGQE